MNVYASCPCCSDKLIHHINQDRDYWFCRQCWQEMPVINSKVDYQDPEQTFAYHSRTKKPLAGFVTTKKLRLQVS